MINPKEVDAPRQVIATQEAGQLLEEAGSGAKPLVSIITLKPPSDKFHTRLLERLPNDNA